MRKEAVYVALSEEVTVVQAGTENDESRGAAVGFPTPEPDSRSDRRLAHDAAPSPRTRINVERRALSLPRGTGGLRAHRSTLHGRLFFFRFVRVLQLLLRHGRIDVIRIFFLGVLRGVRDFLFVLLRFFLFLRRRFRSGFALFLALLQLQHFLRRLGLALRERAQRLGG